MQIKEIMSDNVATLKTDDSIRKAAEKMKNFNIDAIPVIEGENCVGIITDSDIVMRGIADHRGMETNIKFVISKDIHDINSKATIQKAAEVMEEKHVRRLIVRNDDGSVAGILSLSDIAILLNKELAGEVLRKMSEPVPG